MRTHNMGFYEDLTKIIFELSSNTHLNSSAVILLYDDEPISYQVVDFHRPHPGLYRCSSNGDFPRRFSSCLYDILVSHCQDLTDNHFLWWSHPAL